MPVTEISEPGDLGEGVARLRAAVRDHWESLSASERAVAQYLASAPVEQMLFASAQELGTASGTSNATVVRALQRLGYGGLPALKRELATGFTAAVAPEVRLKQRIAHVGRDLDGIWGDVLDEAQERIEQTRRLTGQESLRAAVAALADAGEVHCFGIAASEAAARHLALALGRIGRRSRFLDATGFALADHLLGLRQGDAVVIFQPGRALTELTVLVERARAVGARVVLVTDELGEEFGDRVDAVLTAPHTPTGITSEALTALVVADVLLLALTTLDEERAVDTSHQLTVLREQLLSPKGNRRG
ncbi:MULTISPECIES: MurR/RpiR family transcriptional regulator [Streptomyces]|uniref:MurR/RpiR family transcriptional regulator n=1 Tax=Streptomyces koelreuteriae TaxID=2838015 RepID=A0ABX8G156_9ACTN|nr:MULTISPECIES: MurR/RpiR family transcriptional regulator [Streptomyces]QWB27260.1 MurR/RpiR family transcriptional regulator [Streptomyces koelreuteriae]UUA10344.1 MurR/RpiR family transcriptional regulator [Streptomyces koelreuteriae]UUA17951.1 MurR/RpiR family transcriptional regulator [Streptomyces sp. CRCS-T-1]